MSGCGVHVWFGASLSYHPVFDRLQYALMFLHNFIL